MTAPTISPTGRGLDEAHHRSARGGSSRVRRASVHPKPNVSALGAPVDSPRAIERPKSIPAARGGDGPAGAKSEPISMVSAPRLLDPVLALLAATVSDLEKTRVAAENRHRQLTRQAADRDGEERGYGLPADHPDVLLQRRIVTNLAEDERAAVKRLERAMKDHPLGPWIKGRSGVGAKMASRLLAAIGDPYWNDMHDRPRTVSELWAYCGFRPGLKRQRGVQDSWSGEAKTRSYLIAEKCIMFVGKVEASGRKKPRSPYRDAYDQRRAHTAMTHPDWTDGHSHNDALRIAAKAFLRDLWIESRRLHLEAP